MTAFRCAAVCALALTLHADVESLRIDKQHGDASAVKIMPFWGAMGKSCRHVCNGEGDFRGDYIETGILRGWKGFGHPTRDGLSHKELKSQKGFLRLADGQGGYGRLKCAKFQTCKKIGDIDRCEWAPYVYNTRANRNAWICVLNKNNKIAPYKTRPAIQTHKRVCACAQ